MNNERLIKMRKWLLDGDKDTFTCEDGTFTRLASPQFPLDEQLVKFKYDTQEIENWWRTYDPVASGRNPQI